MSRMTKYLKQTCTLQRVVRDSAGRAVLDKYGEVSYTSPRTVVCRRERYVKDILTTNGRLIKSSSRYYIDVDYQIRADDLLDGNPVVALEEYTNEQGECEGFELYV